MFGANGQLEVFGLYLLGGVVSGILYTCLWLVKLVLGETRLTTIVFDVVFFVATAAIFVISSIKINFSALRFYMMLAFCIGLVLYLNIFQKFFSFTAHRLALKVGEWVRQGRSKKQ